MSIVRTKDRVKAKCELWSQVRVKGVLLPFDVPVSSAFQVLDSNRFSILLNGLRFNLLRIFLQKVRKVQIYLTHPAD